MRKLVAFAALMMAALPARADDFMERATAAKDSIYLSTPALTRETCQALVDAAARKIYVYLIIEPGKGFACDVHKAGLLSVFTVDHIPSAFAFIDFRYVGKGPELEHLTFFYDPAMASDLSTDFWEKAFKSYEMADRVKEVRRKYDDQFPDDVFQAQRKSDNAPSTHN